MCRGRERAGRMEHLSRRSGPAAAECEPSGRSSRRWRRGSPSGRTPATSPSATRTRCRCPASSPRSAGSVEPQSEDWFAYKTSEAEPRAVIAEALRRELGLPFEPEDVALTQGAFGAIALAFRLVMDAGDEVVIPVPGWFCYAPMLRAADLVPVKVALEPARFDLDLAAIDAAITPADPDGGGQLAAQPDRAHLSARSTCRRSPTCSRRPRGGSARASGCSPTSPTAASASTATASPARRRSIPGR